MKKLLFILFILPVVLNGQSKKEKKLLAAQQKENQEVIARLKRHIDSLHTFTSEMGYDPNFIAHYISRQFQSAGLVSFGTTDMVVNSFSTVAGHPDPSTYLKVNGKELTLNKDYFPLPFSTSQQVKGMPAMALRERNLPWFADLKELTDEKNLSDSQLYNLISTETARAAAKGATALLVYNTAKNISLIYDPFLSFGESAIPVVFITEKGLEKYFPDHADLLDIELNVLLVKEQKKTYWNVQAYINNAATNTVTISASYGRHDLSQPNDFCEAAMVIEIVKMLAFSKAKNNNYRVLVSEIPGEYTSLRESNYDLLLDKICLTNENNQLLVEGVETSFLWKKIIPAITQNISVRLDSTSFHRNGYHIAQQIPVLVFASENKTSGSINYDMQVSVLNFMREIVEAADSKGHLQYTQAKEIQNNDHHNIDTIALDIVKTNISPSTIIYKTTVSLGIVPDAKYKGTGLKIKGITPKKTASMIGLQPGDIFLQLGNYPILTLPDYLQALSNFQPGDSTVLKIKRGNEDKEISVVF